MSSVFQIAYFFTKHFMLWVLEVRSHLKVHGNAVYYSHAQNTQKLSAEQWTLNALNKRHIGEIEEVA